jgi:hypothetical protein
MMLTSQILLWAAVIVQALLIAALARQVGVFCVRLGTDGNIFPGGHGHGARDQPRRSCQENLGLGGRRNRHAHDEAGGGDNPVIGAQYGGAQPADTLDQMTFRAVTHHARSFAF